MYAILGQCCTVQVIAGMVLIKHYRSKMKNWYLELHLNYLLAVQRFLSISDLNENISIGTYVSMEAVIRPVTKCYRVQG